MNPLPVLRTGTIHAWDWLCSMGDQFCPPTSGLECPWAAQLPEVVASPSGLMGLKTLCTAGAAIIQLPALLWANWALGNLS